MAAKRKTSPDQPDLPISDPTPTSGQGPASAPKPNGNGTSHVLAEEVPIVAHPPFSPGKIELSLHRRVNTGFLEYASYVIRDRAISCAGRWPQARPTPDPLGSASYR